MDYLALGSDVLLAPASEGYLAYNVGAGRLHQLNPLASLLCELCDGSRSLDEVRDLVLPVVGESGWPACSSWVETALRDGLLQPHESQTTAPSWSVDALRELVDDLEGRDQKLAAYVCQSQLTELTAEDAQGWYRLGELAEATGRRSEARVAFERYLELQPDDSEIRHILTALQDLEAPARCSDEFVQYLFDAFAAHYDETMCDDLGYQAPDLVHEALVAVLGDRQDLDVLDLGCGTGLSGEPFRAHARTLTGVDLSGSMVEKARERSIYDALHVTEITAFLGEPAHGPYDAIVCIDTLIYFGDLRQVVSEAAARLRDGGVLAFSVEASEEFPFRLTDSGRYAHHCDHIVEVAREPGLGIAWLSQSILRFEYGEAVEGLVAVLRRPAS